MKAIDFFFFFSLGKVGALDCGVNEVMHCISVTL